MKLKMPERLKGKLKGRKVKVMFIVGVLLVASYLFFARPQFEEGAYGDWVVTLPVMEDLTVVNLRGAENFGGATAVSVGFLRIDITTTMISFLLFDWQRPTFAENTTIHSVDLWYLQEEVLALGSGGGDASSVCPLYNPFLEAETDYVTRPRVPVNGLQYCSPITTLDLSDAWFSWNMTRMMTDAFGGRATTLSAADVTNVSATLRGELTAIGNRENVEVYFQYGPSLSPDLKTPPMTMDAFGQFSANLTGLMPSTTYWYYAVVQSEGQVYRDLEGALAFVTPAVCHEFAGCSEPPEPPESDPPIPEVEVEQAFLIPGCPECGGIDDYDPDSINETGQSKGPGDPVVGAIMLSIGGHHIFSSEDHNRPERRPYVTYTYTGPRILSPAEAGQVWVWTLMAAAAAPLTLMVFILGRRFGKALIFHYTQKYDREAAEWLYRVNQFQYDAREYGVFGKDEADEDHKEEK
jgi:hypothetical protein